MAGYLQSIFGTTLYTLHGCRLIRKILTFLGMSKTKVHEACIENMTIFTAVAFYNCGMSFVEAMCVSPSGVVRCTTCVTICVGLDVFYSKTVVAYIPIPICCVLTDNPTLVLVFQRALKNLMPSILLHIDSRECCHPDMISIIKCSLKQALLILSFCRLEGCLGLRM